MNFIWDKITEWLKELLVSGVVGNLSGLFDSINSQVADVAGTVGSSPQAWNGSIFGMIKSLSENVMVPIAGIILTFVMCLELIQMLIDRNNMHDFDTFMAGTSTPYSLTLSTVSIMRSSSTTRNGWSLNGCSSESGIC